METGLAWAWRETQGPVATAAAPAVASFRKLRRVACDWVGCVMRIPLVGGVVWASIRLALDGTRGESCHVIVHEERVDDRDGDGAEERGRHELPPVEDVPADQLGDRPRPARCGRRSWPGRSRRTGTRSGPA